MFAQPTSAMSNSGKMPVKILVASPGDVDKERQIVEEVIAEWNICNGDERKMVLEAILWEKHAAPENRGDGEGPQEPITRQIVDDCDCAIGIFWNRIGTPTAIAAGGAVEEVQRMLTVLKRPVMLYFSDMPISPSKIDDQQKAKLKEFKAAMKADGLIWEYDNLEAFRILIARHLDKQIREWFCTAGSPTIKQPIPEDEELRRYQAALKEELGYIRMLGMPGVESIKVNLNNDTFVPLRLSDQQVRGTKSQEQDVQSHEGESHIFSPDEVMKRAFKKRRMLLVIGDPGAGKTTLLKYYALCALEESQRLGFAVPPNVFYLPLRDLVRDKATNHYDSLPANLASWAGKHHQTIGARLFDDWLQSTPSLVLLDGLDEISNTEERKEVCRWIDCAWSGFSKAFFVVTSRATGYIKEDGIELEVKHERADVQDFTPEQQERFLRNWFTAAFLDDPCEKGADEADWERKQRAEAEARTTSMVAHLNGEKNRGLRQLAAIPMILQIMAILWKDRDFMPENRVKLYEASLDYLLEFRDKRRGIKPLLSAAHSRQVLAPVSLWMQEKLKKDEAAKADMLPAMQEWLDTLNMSDTPHAETFCDYLVKRAGLLVETGGKELLFRHKSFREYLAGVQLKEDRPYEHLTMLVSNFGEDWWTEPLRFFIASVDAQVFDAFMQKLLDSPVSEALTTKQQLLLQTIIEEAKGQKVDALCRKLLDSDTTAGRQRVILDCLKAINKPVALSALEQFMEQKLAQEPTERSDVLGRAEELIIAFGGKALERAGDQSVSGKPASYRNPNEENAEYILIPGGNYWYSAMQKAVDVADCYVAKYPLTNKLYRSFIKWLDEKDSGKNHALAYRAALDRIAQGNEWGPGFGDYLKGNSDLAGLFRSNYDEDRKFSGDNQPVVGVKWYAAQAYCLWLSMLEGKTACYRLAHEVEWEWAAGGKQGTAGQKVREYPWLEEKGRANPKLLNYYGSNIQATTPVGSYPDGATPEGLYDMAGNVWEWCSDWYGDDGTFADLLGPETGSLRVLRGGSWLISAERCRSADRSSYPPGDRGDDIGFRLVFVP